MVGEMFVIYGEVLVRTAIEKQAPEKAVDEEGPAPCNLKNIRWGRLHDHSFKMWRLLLRRQPLVPGKIRAPKRAYAAAGPRLPCKPFNRVISILGLVGQDRELAF